MNRSRWPTLLSPGATIGICSPAGPSPPERLAQAADALTRRGYRVIVAPHAAAASAGPLGYLAGDDADRASDLNTFLHDPTIDLILCARGGYGCMRLLDRLDYAAARHHPKPIVGYSDITALSLALLARAGVVSFSGIMASAGDASAGDASAGDGFGQETRDGFSEASFWQMVRADAAWPRTLDAFPDQSAWEILRSPENGAPAVAGPLIPVCLSLLAALAGTPYIPDLSGAILVLEDVHEPLYRLDRMLTQLRLSGALDHVRAVLLGSFTATPDEEAEIAVGLPDVVLNLVPASVPVARGVAYGHIARRLTLPVGAWAEVNLAQSAFSIRGPDANGDDTIAA